MMLLMRVEVLGARKAVVLLVFRWLTCYRH
jgi:hypothetical protein